MFTTAGLTLATTAGTPVLCGGWAWASDTRSSVAASARASFELMWPPATSIRPPLFPPDGQDRTRRGGDDSCRHAADEQFREPGAPVRAHHHEIDALGFGEADDLLVGHALEEKPLRANARLLRLRQQAVQLLLRPRSGR